jgi:anti-anti-sigma factor
MRLRESRLGEIHLFHLQGEVDLHYAPALRSLFSAKSDRQCTAVLVDFSEVTYIDSSGIAVLLEYLRDSKTYKGAFCIAGLTDQVRHIFEVVGLDRVIPMFPTVPEAVAALSNGTVPDCAEALFGTADQQPCAAAALSQPA